MKRIQNITDEPIQRHTIIFDEEQIVLRLRFYPRTEIWCMDLEYKNWQVFGLKLSVGGLHMISHSMPFDFVVSDNSGEGIDPFKRDDFQSRRCTLLMLTRDEMASIRGNEVPA
jgi:hypothetical protein